VLGDYSNNWLGEDGSRVDAMSIGPKRIVIKRREFIEDVARIPTGKIDHFVMKFKKQNRGKLAQGGPGTPQYCPLVTFYVNFYVRGRSEL
jgi:hypothetical protein